METDQALHSRPMLLHTGFFSHLNSQSHILLTHSPLSLTPFESTGQPAVAGSVMLSLPQADPGSFTSGSRVNQHSQMPLTKSIFVIDEVT